MSSTSWGFFHRWVNEIVTDPAFRARHPHMHHRVVPLAMLSYIELGELTEAELVQQAKHEKSFFRGDRVPRIVLGLSHEAVSFALISGRPVVAAARETSQTELRALIRYDSDFALPPWQASRQDRYSGGFVP